VNGRSGWRPVNALHQASLRVPIRTKDIQHATKVWETLLFSGGMRPAWKQLGGETSCEPTDADRVVAENLAQCFIDAEKDYRICEPTLAPAAHRRYYREIAKSANALKTALSLDPRLAAAFNVSIEMHQRPKTDDELEEVGATREPLSWSTDPSVANEAFAAIANMAEMISEVPKTGRPSRNAERAHFIRYLMRHLPMVIQMSRTARSKVIAAAASAIYGQDVEPDLVRALVRRSSVTRPRTKSIKRRKNVPSPKRA
jgi:hypothetical protein